MKKEVINETEELCKRGVLLYSIYQTSQMLNLSEKTVRRLIHRGS